MMRIEPLAGVLALFALAACNTVNRQDVRPAGRVVTEDKSISWMSDLSGNRAGFRGWIHVRVIAPAGATTCEADHHWFDGVNPYPKAKVDKDGGALVTVRDETGENGFSCKTPSGVVRRKIASEKFTYSYFSNVSRTKRTERSFWIVPPLVHIDPTDQQAGARWDALHAELCPEGKITGIAACREGIMLKMKQRDLMSSSVEAAR